MLYDSREKPLTQNEEFKKLLRWMLGHVSCIWTDDCELTRTRGTWQGEGNISGRGSSFHCVPKEMLG